MPAATEVPAAYETQENNELSPPQEIQIEDRQLQLARSILFDKDNRGYLIGYIFSLDHDLSPRVSGFIGDNDIKIIEIRFKSLVYFLSHPEIDLTVSTQSMASQQRESNTLKNRLLRFMNNLGINRSNSPTPKNDSEKNTNQPSPLPFEGLIYRLQKKDKDGQSAYSWLLVNDDNYNSQTDSVFPNSGYKHTP